MRLRVIVLTFILSFVFLLACASNDKKKEKQLPEITALELHRYVHPSYFKNLVFTANLGIERKDNDGLHNYTGDLYVDRTATSALIIDQKAKFKMTFQDTAATISTGNDKPIELDLTNINHNIVLFREVCVIEPNPFRFLKRFYNYYIDSSNNDTTLVIVKENTQNKRVGEIKIYIDKSTGFITDIYFYSTAGDMGRHVEYQKPKRLGEEIMATEIIVFFVSQNTVVRERYRLTDIKIINPKIIENDNKA